MESDIFHPFAYFIARTVLGALFFFQAYDKIFRLGLSEVNHEISEGNRSKGIPVWFSKLSVQVSSYVELLGGLLLMVGLFTPVVLYVFGLHMVLVVVAFGFLQGLWDMKHVFPRFVLLLFLLVAPHYWNAFSLDHWLE